MSTDPTAAPPGFEVSVENAPKAGTPVVEGQAENDEERRKLDAALASTYDPTRTHDGKTDEEMLEEREVEARFVADAVIVTGVIVAHEIAVHHEPDGDEAAPVVHDHGDSD